MARHPAMLDTKREAVELATRHKAIKQEAFDNPTGFYDLSALEARDALEVIKAGQARGLTEMEAAKARPQKHRDAVKQALAEGKPVPDAVLADYPGIITPEIQDAARAAFRTTVAKQIASQPETVIASTAKSEREAKAAAETAKTPTTPTRSVDLRVGDSFKEGDRWLTVKQVRPTDPRFPHRFSVMTNDGARELGQDKIVRVAGRMSHSDGKRIVEESKPKPVSILTALEAAETGAVAPTQFIHWDTPGLDRKS